jgi:transposase
LLDLYHSDEVGFALTLPGCYSWSPVGQRLVVPYEAPQGRRVNGIGAYCTHGVVAGEFVFELCASLPKSKAKRARKTPAERAAAHGLEVEQVGTINAEEYLGFVWSVAGRPAIYPADWKRERPMTLVVDNYSVHKGERVRQELPALAAAGITLFFLPSYSPELSGIEPIWQDVKHHRMTRRSYATLGELYQAIVEALTLKAHDLRAAHQLLAAHQESAMSFRAAA